MSLDMSMARTQKVSTHFAQKKKDNYSFESGSIYFMVSKSLSKSSNTHSRIIYEEHKRISLYVRVEKSVPFFPFSKACTITHRDIQSGRW